MNTNDLWAWKGRIKVTITYLDGCVEVEEFDNSIMDSGRGLLRDALRGALTSNDAQIHYVALGSDNTAVNTSQTQLVNEQFRKAVTQQVTSGANGTTTTVYIAPAEATGFTINEIGWFAGSTATATANSGVMIARVLYNHAKTTIESLQIARTDSF